MDNRLHYSETQTEKRKRLNSSADFRNGSALCGNGNYHANLTRNKSAVTCVICIERLERPETWYSDLIGGNNV